MARVNVTLEDDTMERLSQHAKHLGIPNSAAARDLIVEALARRERRERRHKLARDYAAGRADAAEVLQAMEHGQLEIIDEE